MNGWHEVWERRALDPSRGSLLEQLMAADGLDSGFGGVTEAAWRSFVTDAMQRIALQPHESVYEIGCGAGAFLRVLHEAGIRVGGLDASSSLSAIAREVLPGAEITHAPAHEAPDTAGSWDVVVSTGVFLYFPDADYAERVLARMARLARRAVVVLDVIDPAKAAAALAMRRAVLGEAAYDVRYRGLEHLALAPNWMRDCLEAQGLTQVVTEPQSLAGYANAPFRYNVWAQRPR